MERSLSSQRFFVVYLARCVLRVTCISSSPSSRPNVGHVTSHLCRAATSSVKLMMPLTPYSFGYYLITSSEHHYCCMGRCLHVLHVHKTVKELSFSPGAFNKNKRTFEQPTGAAVRKVPPPKIAVIRHSVFVE